MSVGATLRQAREAKGLSLEDIKNSTQIMTRQLQEMEHDDFSSFAAPIYAKGFIRLFARAVGLDPEPLVREFSAQPMKGGGGSPALKAMPAPEPPPAAPAPSPSDAPPAEAVESEGGDLFSLAAKPRRAVPLPGASGDGAAADASPAPSEPGPATPVAKVVDSTPLAFELRPARTPQPEKRVAALEPGVPAPAPLPSPQIEMRPGERAEFIPPPAAKKLPEPSSAACPGAALSGTGKPVAPDPIPLEGPAFRFPEPRPLPRPESAAAPESAKPAVEPAPLAARRRRAIAPGTDEEIVAAKAPAPVAPSADEDEEIIVARAPRRRRGPRPDAPNAAALFFSNLAASLRRAFPPRRLALAAGVCAAVAILAAGGVWIAAGRGSGASAQGTAEPRPSGGTAGAPGQIADAAAAEPPEPIVAVFPPPFSWAK